MLNSDDVEFIKGYMVTKSGVVYSKVRSVIRSDIGTPVVYPSVIIKTHIDKCGYERFSVSVQGKKKMFRVHQIMAKSFIPNPLSLPQVNHIDGNKQNNTLSNLEWVTNSENQKHAIRIGLKQVKWADQAPKFDSPVYVYYQGELVDILCGNKQMKEKGFDFRLVSATILGKRKSHKGCQFSRTIGVDLPLDIHNLYTKE